MRRTPFTAGLVGVVLSAFAVVSGCSAMLTDVSLSPSEPSLPPYGLVTPQQAHHVIVALGEDPTLVLLDIRTDPEVSAGHIGGAVTLDFYSPTFASDLALLDHQTTVLIYCRTGNRTGQTMGLMTSLGFESVYDLDGGITQWIDQGFPVCIAPLGDEHLCVDPSEASRPAP